MTMEQQAKIKYDLENEVRIPEESSMETQRLKNLCTQIPAGVMASIMGISIITWVFINVVEAWLLYAWCTAALIVVLFRFAIYLWVTRYLNQEQYYTQIETLIVVASAATGLCWGTAALLFLPASDDVFYYTFIGLAMAGFGAGSIFTTYASLPACAAYFFPTIVPITALCALHQDIRIQLLSILMVMFMYIGWKAAYRSNQILLNSYTLVDQKIALSQFLALQNEKLAESQRESEERMRIIAQFSEQATGKAFFQNMVQSIASSLRLHAVFIAELISSETARPIAIWSGGQWVEGIDVTLQGTPCGQVAKGHFTSIPQNLQLRFPCFQSFIDLKAESYAGIPMRDPDGQVIGILGVMDQQAMDDELVIKQTLHIYADRAAVEIMRLRTKKTLRLTQYSLDHIADAAFWLDPNGNVKQANQTACQKLGYTQDEIRRLTVFDLNPQVSHEQWSKRWQTVKSKGRLQIEAVLKTKTGETYPVLFTHNYVCFEDNEFQFILATDISEYKRMDADNQAKSRFLTTMNHELRTPLHGMIGLQDMLSKEASYLQPEHRSHLEMAQHSAQLLKSLIDDILDLSKVEAGKIEIHTADFDLPASLHKIMRTFTIPAVEKHLELQLNFNNLPVHIHADERYIRQIILNLLGNAIKFTEQGCVKVSASFPDQQLSISIEDSGIGIEKEELDRLFEAFEQLSLDAARTGTGLGATISKRLAHAMAGDINVQSNIGVGSIFTLILPIKAIGEERTSMCFDMANISQPATACSNTEYPDLTSQDLCILLVEDDDISRMIASNALIEAGLSVETASHGLEAWEKIQSNDYDLLLTDIRMPGLDGIELTQRVRAREKEAQHRTRIIGLSAHAMKDVVQECLAAGMDDFIAKPIHTDELLRRLG